MRLSGLITLLLLSAVVRCLRQLGRHGFTPRWSDLDQAFIATSSGRSGQPHQVARADHLPGHVWGTGGHKTPHSGHDCQKMRPLVRSCRYLGPGSSHGPAYRRRDPRPDSSHRQQPLLTAEHGPRTSQSRRPRSMCHANHARQLSEAYGSEG
jgi:hypothetical protein